jgi:hypothetical protein
MIIAADYPFMDILWTMFIFFAWIIWIFTLVQVLADVFRNPDMSGWGKAAWTVVTIVMPFLGVLLYLIVHGKDMAERRMGAGEAALARGHERYQAAGAGNGATAQISEAKRLLDSGAIDEAEFARLKSQVLY